jgi:hypothetical protein
VVLHCPPVGDITAALCTARMGEVAASTPPQHWPLRTLLTGRGVLGLPAALTAGGASAADMLLRRARMVALSRCEVWCSCLIHCGMVPVFSSGSARWSCT